MLADLALGLSSRVALCNGVALVVETTTSREGELDLGEAVLEVNAERHECQRLLGDTTRELIDLPAVQEQLAGPHRVEAAEARGVLVRRQVSA